MIKDIGDILKGHLEQFRVGGAGSNQFIDTLAGAVRIVTKTDVDKDNRPVKKTFPVICNLSIDDCNKAGRYMELVPDSKKGCITYFESVLCQFVRQEGAKQQWKAQLRLVSWLNQNKLGYNDCSITSRVLLTFLNAFPEARANSGNYQQVQISVLGQDSPAANPFSKYSYDEDRTQFLMHPYDWFSVLIEVTFEIDKRCITDFTTQTEIPC